MMHIAFIVILTQCDSRHGHWPWQSVGDPSVALGDRRFCLAIWVTKKTKYWFCFCNAEQSRYVWYAYDQSQRWVCSFAAWLIRSRSTWNSKDWSSSSSQSAVSFPFLSIPFHSFPFCFVLPYLPQARSARSSEMQQGRFRSIRHCATVAGLGLVDGLQQQCLGTWRWISSISSISSMVTTWHCGITQWISMVASG